VKRSKQKSGPSAESLLFSGDYQGLLARFHDQEGGTPSLHNLPCVIGALIFVGRNEEAALLFEKAVPRLEHSAIIECRFFLGLSALRASKFSEARRYFRANYAARLKQLGGRSMFFIYQGIALYRFYTGRKVAGAAREALAHSLAADFTYGRVLAGDLLAHARIQRGAEEAGIAELTQALELARRLGNAGLVGAISSSLIIRQARSGRFGSSAADSLRRHLADAPLSDTYSRSNLLLEIARQETLRGAWPEADQALRNALQLIFAFGLKRQEAAMNLAFSELLYRKGFSTEALGFLSSARKDLERERSHPLQRAAAGIERKLRAELGLGTPALQIFSAKGDSVQRRIELRETPAGPRAGRVSADTLGDLLDSIRRQEPGVIERVLSSGYYGLLYDCLPALRGQERLALDLSPGGLTAFGTEGVQHASLGKSRIVRNLLAQLSGGEKTKAELATHVWGYEYHPLRHDTLIYSAVQSARKTLGRYANWIETTESGYRLKPAVTMIHTTAPPAAKNPEPLAAPVNSPGLNYRQVLVLQGLSELSVLNVDEYQQKFKVSKVTASRDLSGLVAMKFIRRVGRARATHYMKG